MKNTTFSRTCCAPQTCRSCSSGCTRVAARRRRSRSVSVGAPAADRPGAASGARTAAVSPSRRQARCRARIGCTGARASCSSGRPCSPATRSTRSPFRYRGNVCICKWSSVDGYMSAFFNRIVLKFWVHWWVWVFGNGRAEKLLYNLY